MPINRRDFLKYLLAAPIAAEFDIEKLLWTPSVHITVPQLPISLWGIPYHYSDASTGTWLGFERTTYPEFSSSRIAKNLIVGISKEFDRLTLNDKLIKL